MKGLLILGVVVTFASTFSVGIQFGEASLAAPMDRTHTAAIVSPQAAPVPLTCTKTSSELQSLCCPGYCHLK